MNKSIPDFLLMTFVLTLVTTVGAARAEDRPSTALEAVNLALERHRLARLAAEEERRLAEVLAMDPAVVLDGVRARIEAGTPIEKLVAGEAVPALDIGPRAATLARVDAFFTALNAITFERGEVVDLIKRALIAEGSVLILGPGLGETSDLAGLIGDNVLENAEDPGSRSFAEPRVTRDHWREEFGDAKIAFIDHVFDAHSESLRDFLKHGRRSVRGNQVEYGPPQLVIAASDQYLPRAYENLANHEAQTVIDGFHFVVSSPGVLRDTRSILQLGEEHPAMPRLSFAELAGLSAFARSIPLPKLEKLRAQHIFISVRRILETARDSADPGPDGRTESPYRPTRAFLPHNLAVAFDLIRIEALLRAAATGAPVRVEAEDVDRALEKYLGLQGPADAMPTGDGPARGPAETVRRERAAFAKVIGTLHAAERAEAERLDRLLANLEERPRDQILLMDLQKHVADCQSLLGNLLDAEELEAHKIAGLGALRRIMRHQVVSAGR